MAQNAFEEIAEAFAFLDDWEDRYRHLIDLGRAMPPLDDALRLPATKVEGCASQVWLVPEVEGQGARAVFRFRGDSDAMIVRGLIAVLIALYDGLTAAEVSAYVVAACREPHGRGGSAKLMVTGLRSLLDFLHVDGVLAESLTAAVPSVAGWRLAGLPRALEPGQVRLLLGSCDRRTAHGRRDFAILTLLARLGLRRAEVARLELDQIDWRAGEIVVDGTVTAEATAIFVSERRD